MKKRLVSVIGVGWLAFNGGVEAADPAVDARLRESLRATTLQLRAVETERATLQAAQLEMEEKNKALTAQVEKLLKQITADKDMADKRMGELNGQLEGRMVEVGRLQESLEKWKASHGKVSELAAKTESQRAKLSGELIEAKRRIADQQAKNLAMYKTGMEILERYERFGLGEALTAREPFVGITRVKFQNLVQDYGDKLEEQKVKP